MGKTEPGVIERQSSTLSLKGRGTGAQRQGEGPRARGKTPDLLLSRARQMRHEPTEAEAKLWSGLRAGRLNGAKFRRQVPIGPYIADFVCPAAKLIVELDGSQHADQQAYDARRTGFLVAEGYRVIRFWNHDVLGSCSDVLEAILQHLDVAAPLPGALRLSLSPSGRGVFEEFPA
jgi:very-short-patch-repair endonuclease